MATYYIDDGGDNTTGASWATAWNSFGDMLASGGGTGPGTSGNPLANGDIVYVGYNMVDGYTYTADSNVYGPTTGSAKIISADPATTVYTKFTTDQYDTSDGSYDIYIRENISCYGIAFKAGDWIFPTVANFGRQYYYECRFKVGTNDRIYISDAIGGHHIFEKCEYDDQSVGGSNTIISRGDVVELRDMLFSNCARSGDIWGDVEGKLIVSGADLSSCTSTVTLMSYTVNQECTYIGNNILTASTFTPFGGTVSRGQSILLTNVGPAYAPTYIAYDDYYGRIISSSSIYRTGGATVESTNTGWLVTTKANPTENIPFYTPWVYGVISSTGSKTFTTYITNDTADFYDDEVWLQVEYLGTASEANFDLTSDRRVITATHALQTDDTSSTWNGTGPSFTYKQALAATATVNQTGLFRARVVVAKASIASTSYFYIDPLCTVS